MELNLIVLFQVLFVLKSFYKVPKAQIADVLLSLLAYRGTKISDKKIVREMLETWRDTSLEIVDSYLVACLKKAPGRILYSYGRDFDKFNINRKEP